MEKEFQCLQDAEKSASFCIECDLHNNRCKSVFAKGNPNAQIMLVGEAPGKCENTKGIPFVGKAGDRLTKMLISVGFDVEKDIYFCNTVKCQPFNNRNPKPKEIETCKKYLDAQIKFVNPKIIILCGKVAAQTFGFEENLKDIHGKFIVKNNIKFFVIFHPIASINNEIKIKDFKKVKGEM